MKNGVPEEKLYQIALTKVPQVGCVQARILIDQFKTARNVFQAKKSELEKINGIGTVRAQAIKSFRGFNDAEKELEFTTKHAIQTLFLTDETYPRRLLNCFDPPTLLYYKGSQSLNASRMVAIIGTRQHSEYGKQLTEKIICDLAQQPIVIVSGLAFGVDALAHRNAMKYGLPTIGVLAHGLDTIYPPQHRSLAKDMLKEGGGLLTEFGHQQAPDKHHFPTRNRIVAGMCDAVVVIESGEKGGSMVTAELANGYNKDVFALPGRSLDPKSSGCNKLIKNNKALLIEDGNDIIQSLGWEEKASKSIPPQISLFVQLNPQEKALTDILSNQEDWPIDLIQFKTGMSASVLAATLLSLEMQNIIVSLPGKRYKMI